ncbi:MAG TPA: phosphatidylglycerophosphatase A [Stellaceae bacterium]|nr:phosphatidylglycerophosphatase A [Stellaceae bacterium]
MSGRRPLGLPALHPAALIATGCGIGLLPVAPGTWASLAALPCGWLLRAEFGAAGLLLAAAVAFAAGCWAAGRVAEASGIFDPGFAVVDEVAAQLLALAAAPLDWRYYLAAFLLFRLFDIWKPFPVDWLDRHVKGGFGIMLDDVAAALYAVVLIAIGEGVLGVRP